MTLLLGKKTAYLVDEKIVSSQALKFHHRPSTVYVNMLNRSKDKDLATRIDNQEGAFQSEVGAWEMNHPDLKAMHTFGDDKKALSTTRSFKARVENNGFNYTFPAHSLTILRLRLK
jgi:alpha-L-arabinofuranosidase